MAGSPTSRAERERALPIAGGTRTRPLRTGPRTAGLVASVFTGRRAPTAGCGRPVPLVPWIALAFVLSGDAARSGVAVSCSSTTSSGWRQFSSLSLGSPTHSASCFFFPFSFRNGGEGRFPNRAHRGCRLDILYITRC
jgi:hypothetical protein